MVFEGHHVSAIGRGHCDSPLGGRSGPLGPARPCSAVCTSGLQGAADGRIDNPRWLITKDKFPGAFAAAVKKP